jgi:hypothetical protein
MKRSLTVIGLLLLILVAGSSCHRAWQHKRDMNGSGRMISMRMAHNWRGYGRHFMWQMRGMCGNMSQASSGFGMRGMRSGMGYGMRGMNPGMGFGMRGMNPGMGYNMNGMGRMDSVGRMPAAPGLRLLASIPNVTENQKKQIEDLMKKNQDEMKKLRDEMSSKMQALRDAHRKDVLNILTPDQKKYLESGKDRMFSSPENENR